MNAKLNRWLALLAAVFVCSLATCSRPGVPGTPRPTAPAIAPAPAVVAVGTRLQFTAAPSAAVIWGVSEARVGPAPAFSYPLKVSRDGRYLVDRTDRPWRVQADAGWLMSSNATPAQVDTYLDTRRAQGFNSFYLMAMVHPGGYRSAPHAPLNYAGVGPFTTPNLFSTPNEAYWSWIDSIIDKAAARNMVVMFAYTYLGYRGEEQGWASTLLAQPSRQACADWGAWLGNRYKGKPNLIWFTCGDHTPPARSELESRVIATIEGIKSTGATQLFMAEMGPGKSVPTIASPAIAPYLDMNSFYGYGNGAGDCYEQADQAYRASPPKPAWVQEGGYEFEDNTEAFPADTSYGTRRTRFWSALAGGVAGDGFGSADAWQWLRFPSCLSTPGAAYAQIAFQLFSALPWWDLRPSGSGAGFAGRALVVSGAGKWGRTDRVTSAVTSDGKVLLAYVPGAGGGASPATITIDMAAMAGPTRARWFNPANGSYSAAAERSLPGTGLQTFTTPGDNGGGANDWLLVLDSGGAAPCGTITPSGLYSAPSTVTAGLTCSVTAAPVSAPSAAARIPINLR